MDDQINTIVICTAEGCNRPATVRGWCDKHYRAALRSGAPRSRKKPLQKCSVGGCETLTTHKYCIPHERRWRRSGSPTYLPPTINGGRCRIDDCEAPARSDGLCIAHYARQTRTGDTASVRPMLTQEQIRLIQESDDPAQELAQRFGTNLRTIVAVKAGRSWGWLNAPTKA